MNASCQMFQKHSNISIELDSGDNKVEKIAPDIHPSDFKFYQLHSLNVYKFFLLHAKIIVSKNTKTQSL